MLFINRINRLNKVRSFSSCNYNQPFLFGPMFSSLFFGGFFAFNIMSQNLTIYRNLEEKINNLEKNINELKDQRIKR